MTCHDYRDLMMGYLDNELTDEQRRQFEEHLAGCNPCQVVVDNIRKTITLYKAGEPYPMPPEFHDRLHETLRARWKEKFGG